MSTMHEKVEAQQWAFYSKPTQPFHRHLIGPAELEALLTMVEQLQTTHVGAGDLCPEHAKEP